MSARLSRLPVRAGNRAVIYTRQSTHKEESISLDVQERAAREHCERQGYDVVAVESDPGVSGRSWKQRRGVQSALAAVEAGDADVIVVWRWSRLSRSRRDWAVAADAADLAGGRIESATEPNDATAAGRFARGVMTELAAFESERIGEQWQEAREHRVARGLPSTGGPRFGYRIVERVYQPDPETAPVLAELYALYLGGQGSSQLTRMLNERGIAHGRKEGRPWAYQDTLRVLDSGFAAGLLVKTPPRPKGQPNLGQRTIPVWEREFRPGAHEPIIDRATWDAYVAARRARTKTRVRRESPMLAGLLVCLECGGPMHHNQWSGGRMYVCSRGSMFTGVRQVSITAHMIEPGVEAWLFEHAENVSKRRAAIEQTSEHAARVDMTARRAEQQLAKVDDRLLRLTMLLADDALDAAAYKQAVAALEAERADATARLHSARRNPAREAAPATLPPDLARLWPGMTPATRNAVLRPLIARIEVRPAKHRGERAQRWRLVPAWEADAD